MKMKKHIQKLFICLATMAALTSACKKKNEEVTPAKQTCYITTVKNIYTNHKDSTTIEYNIDNKVSKISSFDSTKKLTGYDLYTFSSNKIDIRSYDGKGTMNDQVSYYLNSDGTANYSTELSTSSGSGQTQYDTAYYSYDNGYIVKKININVSIFGTQTHKNYDTTWYTYTDGNLQKEIYKSSGQTTTTTYAYSSLEDKNNFGSLDPLIPGLGGKGNKNLIQSGRSDNTNANTDSYNYIVDSNGLITHMIESYSFVSGTGITANIFESYFYYICK